MLMASLVGTCYLAYSLAAGEASAGRLSLPWALAALNLCLIQPLYSSLPILAI